MTEFGIDSSNPFYEKCGRMVFEAWSHGISRGRGDWFFVNPGRQPEQFFQTNWVFPMKDRFADFSPDFISRLSKFGYHAGNVDELNPRGGSTPWDVSWIIALVLDAELSFTGNNG